MVKSILFIALQQSTILMLWSSSKSWEYSWKETNSLSASRLTFQDSDFFVSSKREATDDNTSVHLLYTRGLIMAHNSRAHWKKCRVEREKHRSKRLSCHFSTWEQCSVLSHTVADLSGYNTLCMSSVVDFKIRVILSCSDPIRTDNWSKLFPSIVTNIPCKRVRWNRKCSFLCLAHGHFFSQSKRAIEIKNAKYHNKKLMSKV